MKVSIIQSDLKWEDKSRNLRNLENLIYPLFNQTDIVILPEMFNTGFSMNSKQLSESPRAETFDWMKRMSQRGDFGLCGSFMVQENKKFFNRFVFVSPEDEFWQYDKRHLFSLGGENKNFSPGKSHTVFTFRNFRISLFICYDLRFPVWNRKSIGCDLMIYTANWPSARSNAWKILLRARAIENQCFVAGANRIGTDGNGINYDGESMIIGPKGDIITSAAPNAESFITAEISLDELSGFRKKFPFLTDADKFTIDS